MATRDGASMDDASLVACARSGQSWAQGALYRRHEPWMLRVAIRVTGCRADAEDVVQDAFVVVLDDVGRLRDPSLFSRWLYRVVVNTARGRLRRRKRARALGLECGEGDGALARTACPSVSPDVVADLALIDRALRRIEVSARMVWILNRVGGWTLQEIADAFSISVPTAKRRGWRVDAALREFAQPAA